MKLKIKQLPIWIGLMTFSVLLTGIPVAESTVHAIGETQYSPANASLVITPTPDTWTNKSIILTVKGSLDNGGIAYIRLPNGSIVNGSTATFVVSENGYYPFVAQDVNGQYLTGGFTVSRIEKVIPLVSMPNLPTTWVNKDIAVVIEAE